MQWGGKSGRGLRRQRLRTASGGDGCNEMLLPDSERMECSGDGMYAIGTSLEGSGRVLDLRLVVVLLELNKGVVSLYWSWKEWINMNMLCATNDREAGRGRRTYYRAVPELELDLARVRSGSSEQQLLLDVCLEGCIGKLRRLASCVIDAFMVGEKASGMTHANSAVAAVVIPYKPHLLDVPGSPLVLLSSPPACCLPQASLRMTRISLLRFLSYGAGG